MIWSGPVNMNGKMGTLLTSLKKYNEKKEDIVEQRREKKETW